MKKLKTAAVLAATVASVALLGGCAAQSGDRSEWEEEQVGETVPPTDVESEIELPETSEKDDTSQTIPEETPEPEPAPAPVVKTVSYVVVTADGVNIRSGAGTNYTAVASAEQDTLYEFIDLKNGWYQTTYRNKTVYISSKYCREITIDAASDEVESVIAVGAKLLGTPYVYGAVRLHDGNGNLYRGFSVTKFDCSSLIQYMFYYGANKLLDVNTRTQVYQGVTVPRSQLQRGDLIFFTNASRYNNKGIERIGHVAIYLGDNYILHTASDYAKIEQISAQRWGYYIQAQRMI